MRIRTRVFQQLLVGFRPAWRGRDTVFWGIILAVVASGIAFDLSESLFGFLAHSRIERWQLDELFLAFPILAFGLALQVRRHAYALHLRDARFRALVDHSSDIIAIVDRNGTLRYVSPAFVAILGEAPTAWARQNALSLVHPDDHAKLTWTFARLLRTPGAERTIEVRVRHRTGAWRNLEVVATNRLADPAVVGLVANARDITEHRQVAAALRVSEARYRDLFEQAPVKHIVTIEGGNGPHIADCNQRFAETLGYSRDEIIGRPLAQFYAPEDRHLLTDRQSLAQIASGELGTAERRLLTRDGRIVETLLRVRPVLDLAGELVGSMATYVDVSEQKQAMAAKAAAERDYRQLFELAGDAILVFDPEDEVVLDVNARACALYGLNREEFLGRSLLTLSGAPDLTRPPLTTLLREGGSQSFETVQHRADGTPLTLEINVSRIVYRGRPAILSINRDVTAHKSLQAELAYRAFHDDLTGLPNRTLFADRLTHALQGASRRGESVAVLMLDLDRFKLVNDELGHAAGDQLLIAVTRQVMSCLRESDTFARFGGDEFAILLEDATISTATLVAERIVASFSQPHRLENREIYSTASIGIMLSTPDHAAPDDLMRTADSALYRAKQAGRSRWVVYDPDADTPMEDRLALEAELRQAIANGELVLHYQPVLDLSDGHLVGVEALTRWQHPERGVIPPGSFIPLAEETGLITEITTWVAHEACRQFATWRRDLGDRAPSYVAINITTRDLRDPELVDRVTDALVAARVPPACLRLEITERVLATDVSAAVETLRVMRSRGVGLALDDFGAGSSSLAALRAVEIEVLKLDRTFLQGIETDPEARVFLEAVTAMAHTLGVIVTAEGIETTSQLDAVCAAGCDRGQGYVFTRPLPPADLVNWLAHRPPRVSPVLTFPRLPSARTPLAEERDFTARHPGVGAVGIMAPTPS